MCCKKNKKKCKCKPIALTKGEKGDTGAQGKEGPPGPDGPPGPSASAWLLNGNSEGAEKYLGTNDGFDLPIYTNNIRRLTIKNTGEFEYLADFTADSTNSTTFFGIKDNTGVSLLAINKNGGFAVGIGAGNGATCADMVAIGYHAAYSLGTTPTNGFNSVFVGAHAGEFSETPSDNVSIGEFAGRYSNATNNINIGSSAGSGTSLYTGTNNVFISQSAGEKISSGGNNIGIGYLSLGKVTTTSYNIGIGTGAGGYVNTYTGDKNISIGHNAGSEYSTASGNIMIGYTTGSKTSTGNYNIFIGEGIATFTGSDNSGDKNLCIGQYTGYSLNSGDGNTLLGVNVGQYITSGSYNIFLGNNISNGANKISTGTGNILIGYNLDTDTANPSNVLKIGDTLISGVFNATPANQTLRINAGKFELPSVPVGDAGLTSGQTYFDTAANILSNGDLILARVV